MGALTTTRTLTLAAVGVALGAIGFSVYYAQQVHDHQARIDVLREQLPATLAESPAAEDADTVTDVPSAPEDLDGDQWRAWSRERCRTVLDVDPSSWTPGPRAEAFRTEVPYAFGLDDLPAPSAAARARFEDAELVRPLPYPYFAALSVPSDCCGTHAADVFYTQGSISRRFGLDLPSSFFPYTSMTSAAARGWTPAVFAGRGAEPLVAPITIEGQAIDAWPLFLTAFHRGWFDHIHGWSAEAVQAYSLIDPVVDEIPESGELDVDVVTKPSPVETWHGLELELGAAAEIDAIEITLVDRVGHEHVIAIGAPLRDRTGWSVEMPAPTGQIVHVYLPLTDEVVRRDLNVLGDSVLGSTGGPFTAARLTARGRAGALVVVNGIRTYDITRTQVRRHMKTLTRHNVLPNVSTLHGGFSTWAAVLGMPEYTVEVDCQPNVVDRQPLGVESESPTYIADALRAFGIEHHSRPFEQGLPECSSAMFREAALRDGTDVYLSTRYAYPLDDDDPVTAVSPNAVWAESFGAQIARALTEDHAAPPRAVYHHFNVHGEEAFTDGAGPAQMSDLKAHHPHTEAALSLLSELKYDRDGRCAFYQRVWTCPISVNLRFMQAHAALGEHVRRDGDRVMIESWVDPVRDAPFPDSQYASQDLHGATFYVPDAAAARVIVDGREVTSLKRNAADFTGRASVTVVDAHTPTLVFDEVDLYEMTGAVTRDGASYFFAQRAAYRGTYAMEVQAERDGRVGIAWEPFDLTSHETDFLSFAYRKTAPESVMEVQLVGDGGTFVVTEGALAGRMGWEIPHRPDQAFHEVVVDFADLQAPRGTTKPLPRSRVQRVEFGLAEASARDSVFFDRVAFLAARGVRPDSGDGVLIGGRVHPPVDQQRVRCRYGDMNRETTTTRGGWYFFPGVPRESIVEVTVDRDGVTYLPARGRLLQVARSDVEINVFMHDPRSPSVPRPALAEAGAIVPSALSGRSVNADADHAAATGAVFAPHIERFYAGLVGLPLRYVVQEQVNNHGFIDKDRRFENPDDSLRIMLLGECWTEGGQTPVHQHYATLVESMLRRRLGRNVEVITHSTSNSSPGTNALVYERYGRRFEPDVVVLMADLFPLLSLDGPLQQRLVGWSGEHAPYRMYGFDDGGGLVAFPPDPNYPAFTVAPDNTPLIGELPVQQGFATTEGTVSDIDRALDLLRAVLAERYVAEISGRGGAVCLAYGYDKDAYAGYGTRYGNHATAPEAVFHRLASVCRDAGAVPLNLADQLFTIDYPALMVWEEDRHLTPTGHYRMAEALVDRLLALPEVRVREATEGRSDGATEG